MPSKDELIDDLSGLYGIIHEYFDVSGNRHVVPVETKRAILRAMRLRIDSSEDIEGEIERVRSRPWRDFIEPVKVIPVNQPLIIPLYIPIGEGEDRMLMLTWSIGDEKGQRYSSAISGDDITISEHRWIDGIRYIRADIVERRALDIGYYSLDVECRHPEDIFSGGKTLRKTARLIITPDTCYIPPELQNGKTWGLFINLYSIRSARNWGIGDFADLRGIVRWVAGLGGDLVGVNPLHAIPNELPYGISPYSPISRLYRNFIYLDMEGIPEVVESEEIISKIDGLRKGGFIDYERVALLKEKALRIAFDTFYERNYMTDSPRGREFRRYILDGGYDLESFATYMALSAHFGTGREDMSSGSRLYHSLFSWQQWPVQYHDPSGEAVQRFKETHKREILFYQYVQWLIDGQLREARDEAKDLGMTVGLYHDLAVGSIRGGSDAWCYKDIMAEGVDVGAPPDDFSPDGQNWGFPPIIPDRLKDTGYEMFINTIRANMKYGGALRIDHALGMFRLFWIPHGMSPGDGAYIRYPAEDLLRIIALESVRNKTMVIAEDLGTIGEDVRETLRRFDMLSYRLFYFERNYPDPSFIPPDKYPDMALCAVTTHDLPTLYGYWAGQDINVRKGLGKYPDERILDEHLREREKDKVRILRALRSEGILPDFPEAEMIPEMTAGLCLAIYEYLAKTPCKLLLVSLDDIMGTLDQQNMPGTVNEYPNWIQKTTMTLEEIFSDRRFIALAGLFASYNRGSVSRRKASNRL